MLDREEIYRAVDLHRRSYKLLRWLGTAISKGFVRFDRAHEYMDEAGAAKDWIEYHFLNLPPSCRPPLDQVEPFAQFFATYLTTSFELVEKPKPRIESACGGCFCPICVHLVAAPHLRARKVSRRDKERARKLKVAALQQLALEQSTSQDQKELENLIDSPDIRTEISLVAYGLQLIARTNGRSDGPAVLALWREIAWNQSGSPKKDFKLEAENILKAKELVAQRIRGV